MKDLVSVQNVINRGTISLQYPANSMAYTCGHVYTVEILSVD
jgi:hypothetical protein